VEEVEKLFKNSTEEMEKLLTAKSVVGESMVVDGYTIVPFLSLGFGFGAGGGGGKGKDKDNQEGEGSGGGTGGGTDGGGGVKPVAVIISKDGIRVEPIQDPLSGLEKLGAAIGAAMASEGTSLRRNKRDADTGYSPGPVLPGGPPPLHTR
jgi:uncharacterized spore protein YtfJ